MNKWSRGDRITFFLLTILSSQISIAMLECWKERRAAYALYANAVAQARSGSVMGKGQWDAMLEMQSILRSSLDTNIYALILLFLFSMIVTIVIGRQHRKFADFREQLEEKHTPPKSQL